MKMSITNIATYLANQPLALDCLMALAATAFVALTVKASNLAARSVRNMFNSKANNRKWHNQLEDADLQNEVKRSAHDWYSADKGYENSLRQQLIQDCKDAPTRLAKLILMREIIHEDIKRIIREHRDTVFTNDVELDDFEEHTLDQVTTQNLQQKLTSQQDTDEA